MAKKPTGIAAGEPCSKDGIINFYAYRRLPQRKKTVNKLINSSKNVPRMVCIFSLLLHKAQPEEVIL
jgi:hypothetical protein